MSFLEAQGVPRSDPAGSDPDWWRGAVIYQIYPRSYQDANGDGVGDLSGIIHRLGHVADLGVDAIWISPFFRSPMHDFGYDVSDYRDVDPMFGTLGDFDALVSRAHGLGLKVIIDLVMSHTAAEHPWFTESRSSRDNVRADWYVWSDPKPDGTPPNNWLSIFGGPAWEWDGQRMQYYLHNFLADQPDLNFHCEAVQDAMLSVARYWLERGVDGFRLDTVNFYFHDRDLRDNPALPAAERNDNTAPSVNPYNFQDHRYDKTQPENLGFLERLRSLMDEFDAVTSVGEIGESQRGTEVQAAYTKPGRLHMAYDFDFLASPIPTGTRVAEVLAKIETQVPDGWACWAFSNHDVVRHPTRWRLGDAAVRVYAALLLSLRGSVCLYQGEELGLAEAYVAYEDLQDPYGKRFWPEFKGRDGARTPMPWSADMANGGFSEARPWLPVAVEHLDDAVDAQDRDETSMLRFYRSMLAYRAARSALRQGGYQFVAAEETYVAFVRETEAEAVFCAFNLGPEAREVTLPEGRWSPDAAAPLAGDGTTLGPYGAIFATRSDAG